MLTQVARSASTMQVTLEETSIDVRASFPKAEPFGGPGMERLDYTLDLRTAAAPDVVRELVRRAEEACHAANSLRAPVTSVIRLNGEELPA